MSNFTPDHPVDLDRVYTELAQATARVGAEKTPLFLATLALAMLLDRGIDARSLEFIAQAERLVTDEQRTPGQ